jgi:hypothetical protein
MPDKKSYGRKLDTDTELATNEVVWLTQKPYRSDPRGKVTLHRSIGFNGLNAT